MIDSETAPLLDRCSVVLFDVDGTLTDERLRIAPESGALVVRLLSLGKHVGIVTSRGIAELDELVRALAPHAPGVPDGRLTFFPSTGTEAYVLDAAGLRATRRWEEPAVAECAAWLGEALVARGWTRIDRHPVRLAARTDFLMRERGPQLTLFFSTRTQTDTCIAAVAQRFPGLRAIRDGGWCVHLVPAGAGKHLALEHARRVAPGMILAVADGFSVDEEGLPGNDVDLDRPGVVCAHVGRRPPQSEAVLFFPPPRRAAFEATAQALDAVARHPLPALRHLSDQARAARAADLAYDGRR